MKNKYVFYVLLNILVSVLAVFLLFILSMFWLGTDTGYKKIGNELIVFVLLRYECYFIVVMLLCSWIVNKIMGYFLHII